MAHGLNSLGWKLRIYGISGLPFLILTVILLDIVPTFRDIFTALGGTVPLRTRILFHMSAVGLQFWPFYAFLSIALWFATARYLLRNSSTLRGRACSMACVLPVIIFLGWCFWALLLPAFHLKR